MLCTKSERGIIMFRKSESWIEIVSEQEKLLLFENLSNETLLQLGLKIIELALAKYKKGVSVRIIYHDAIVFSHMMEGCSLENDWWMTKKQNTCLKTGLSSLLSFLKIEYGLLQRESWCDMEGNYALCGGCFPLRLTNGSIAGYALVSALPHELDHQLLADALAQLLHVDIPVLLPSGE